MFLLPQLHLLTSIVLLLGLLSIQVICTCIAPTKRKAMQVQICSSTIIISIINVKDIRIENNGPKYLLVTLHGVAFWILINNIAQSSICQLKGEKCQFGQRFVGVKRTKCYMITFFSVQKNKTLNRVVCFVRFKRTKSYTIQLIFSSKILNYQALTNSIWDTFHNLF